MKNKALFLDRDGVINVEKNYVHKIEDFEFVDGIFEVMKWFQRKGYLIFVITNQAGIGRGYYSEEDFMVLTQWMLDSLSEQEIEVKKVYYCPYHPVHGVGKYKKKSINRKPNPGMILNARDEYDLDLESSVLIGDKESDIEAGIAAGIQCNVMFGDTISNKANINVIQVIDIIEYF